MRTSPKKPEQRRRRHAAAVSPRSAALLPRAWLVAVVLALSIAAVYGRAWRAPFVFDDADSVEKNSSIRSLYPLVGSAEHPGPLNPPKDLPISGRPVVNLTFAMNYAVGELDPASYHVTNFALHFLSAVLVWAIVRLTLRLPYFDGRFDSSADSLALCVSLLWALHPVQSEAVVYVTQRTELMVAFCYLATFYCSLRFWSLSYPAVIRDPAPDKLRASSNWPLRAAWLSLAVLVCGLGMASKEVMVSAPLMVLLFDRAFIAGSLKSALRRSWPLYAGLASTWLILLLLNLGAPRSDSAGFSLGVSAYQWWLTQTQVVFIYLRLVVWPSPLLLHYDLPYLTNLGEAWAYIVPVFLLAAGVGVLLWRNRPLGFLGTFFFAVLSPTLVVPIVTEIVAERRLYLPLLVPVILFVIGGYSLLQWVIAGRRDLKIARPIFVCVPLVIVLVCGIASAKRVKDYDNEINLWRSVLKIQPDNYTAHTNLGRLLLNSGHIQEAIDELQRSLARKPDNYRALNALGIALDHLGRYDEAIKVQNEALRVNPNYTDSLQNLANSLRDVGRLSDAKVQLEKALRLKPDDAEAQNNMGVLMMRQNQTAEAIERFRLAAQLDPRYAAAHINLGKTLAASGATEEAIRELQTAIRLQPSRADLHNELGIILGQNNQQQLAAEQFQMAVELDPKLAQAYSNLALSLAFMNRSAEAVANAQRGIEVGRSTGQRDTAAATEEWLLHYRNELDRAEAKTKP